MHNYREGGAHLSTFTLTGEWRTKGTDEALEKALATDCHSESVWSQKEGSRPGSSQDVWRRNSVERTLTGADI